MMFAVSSCFLGRMCCRAFKNIDLSIMTFYLSTLTKILSVTMIISTYLVSFVSGCHCSNFSTCEQHFLTKTKKLAIKSAVE